MIGSLNEGFEKLSVIPNYKLWDKDEGAIGESSEGIYSGTGVVAAEGVSIDPTATKLGGMPRGLGVKFRLYENHSIGRSIGLFYLYLSSSLVLHARVHNKGTSSTSPPRLGQRQDLPSNYSAELCSGNSPAKTHTIQNRVVL